MVGDAGRNPSYKANAAGEHQSKAEQEIMGRLKFAQENGAKSERIAGIQAELAALHKNQR